MKKLISLAMVVLLGLTLFGCNANDQSDHVMYAWTGEFTEEKLKEAISKYEKYYEPIVIAAEGGLTSVSVDMGFPVAGCSLPRLAHVDANDPNAELHGYIDLFLMLNRSDTTVVVPVDWWNEQSNYYPVWSYLVSVTDTDGVDHYYYFRTDYSALMQDAG